MNKYELNEFSQSEYTPICVTETQIMKCDSPVPKNLPHDPVLATKPSPDF